MEGVEKDMDVDAGDATSTDLLKGSIIGIAVISVIRLARDVTRRSQATNKKLQQQIKWMV